MKGDNKRLEDQDKINTGDCFIFPSYALALYFARKEIVVLENKENKL